jgi:hypothetical protein
VFKANAEMAAAGHSAIDDAPYNDKLAIRSVEAELPDAAAQPFTTHTIHEMEDFGPHPQAPPKMFAAG